ncbi:hypothetical protein H5T52_08210 [Candidatus Bipolaricaulota bacterium]|nr:hypothetical protein [Candidatus Bipolaricaulota bacterium]
MLTVGALRTELCFCPRPRAVLGVGQRARARLRWILEGERPAGVLVVGFSGATRASLPVGTLVLAESARGVRVPDGLLERARKVLPGAKVGPVAQASSLASPEEKARLGVEALAVDMESADLAAELSSRGVPFLILRCILDALWEDPSRGPHIRWARRALLCARRLGQGARALIPVLEGAA